MLIQELGVDELSPEAVIDDKSVIPANGQDLYTQEASDSEQAVLETVVDAAVGFIHGDGRPFVTDMLSKSPDLFVGVSTVAFQMMRQIHDQAIAEGSAIPEDMWFAENGLAQNLVEEVFEVANAMGLEGSDDENQLQAAYMDLMRQYGETEFNKGGKSVEAAQELLLDIELGQESAAEEALQGII